MMPQPLRGLKMNLSGLRSLRQTRRWRRLKAKGMHIGDRVRLPMTTWIDTSHCFLISIEDNCVFGENCAILAHDALARAFIGAARLGRVRIKESSKIGMGTIIMPGVTIGPRSIVGAGSVVVQDIPEGVVAAGNPARVICTLEGFLAKERKRLQELPTFPYSLYDIGNLTADRRREMLKALEFNIGYMTAG